MDAIPLQRKAQSESPCNISLHPFPRTRKKKKSRKKKQLDGDPDLFLRTTGKMHLGKKQLHLHDDDDDVYEEFPRKGQTLAVTIDPEDAYRGAQFRPLMDMLLQ